MPPGCKECIELENLVKSLRTTIEVLEAQIFTQKQEAAQKVKSMIAQIVLVIRSSQVWLPLKIGLMP